LTGAQRYWKWTQSIVSVLGARSFAAAAAFLGNVLVARQLGDADFGRFYLLFSIMTVVAGLTGPAVDTSLVRFAVKKGVTSHAALPYFKAVLHFKVVLLVVTLFFGLAAVRPILQTLFEWNPDDPAPIRYYYVLLAFLGGAVVSMWGFSQSFFQAHQRFTEYAGYEFCSSLLRLGLVLALCGFESQSVLLFLGVYVAAPFVMALISWSQLPSEVFRAKSTLSTAGELLSFGKWVLLATIFTTLTQRLDIILLNVDAFGIPKDAVGRYSAAVSIALAGELVLLTFYSVLLPKASQLRTAGELRQYIGQFRIPSLLFSLALTMTIPLAGPFCRFVLGEEYLGTEVYFGILILGVVVSVACAPTVTALYSLGHSRTVSSMEGIRLVLTLGLGLLVVPQYGVWGMAMVIMGVRASVSVLTYLVAHNRIKQMTMNENAVPAAS
jgi:O-antigen/teichoic acid export membrane protein